MIINDLIEASECCTKCGESAKASWLKHAETVSLDHPLKQLAIRGEIRAHMLIMGQLLQGLPQQIHQEEEEDDWDDELTNKESMKHSIKEMRFRGHPDIVHVTKKKELDPDIPALRLMDG
ncbi:hypothetical protein MKW92_033511, partial [Papaver armeniacum]